MKINVNNCEWAIEEDPTRLLAGQNAFYLINISGLQYLCRDGKVRGIGSNLEHYYYESVDEIKSIHTKNTDYERLFIFNNSQLHVIINRALEAGATAYKCNDPIAESNFRDWLDIYINQNSNEIL